MGAIASEAMNQDFGWEAAVETIFSPFIGLVQFVVGNFAGRRAPSSSTVAWVKKEFRGYLFRFAGRHVEVAKGA